MEHDDMDMDMDYQETAKDIFGDDSYTNEEDNEVITDMKNDELVAFKATSVDGDETILVGDLPDKDEKQWTCPRCSLKNSFDDPICKSCHTLPPADNENETITHMNTGELSPPNNNITITSTTNLADDKYRFLETDVFEFSKTQSCLEEWSLLCAYVIAMMTVTLIVTCAIVGMENDLFLPLMLFAILSLVITVALSFAYNRVRKSMKANNLCASMIVLNGNENKMIMMNAKEHVIFGCFHWERYGETLWECNIGDIQRAECVPNEKNEMIFIIYYFDSQGMKQNSIKNFENGYFFCNTEWARKFNYEINKAKSDWGL